MGELALACRHGVQARIQDFLGGGAQIWNYASQILVRNGDQQWRNAGGGGRCREGRVPPPSSENAEVLTFH